ncbi:phenylalanine--tRNA ligase subunit alpha [Mesorhizobium sp. RP14(2022)]|uniref:Phenylalanine--tRNA ligase alpha subunit n=1 Tax=Mesorhizobium liriopis TaxID=2953882 RepID=A0ABT1C3M1_9HYPH|nr:phenylalanine--tRNA ligase subunit alpha [Mesorhizobium liriopis]
MSEASLDHLEQGLLADIAAAGDEQSLEAVRVAALGKKGSVSEQLKSLGTMSPEQRQAMGPAINGLKTRITEALATRRTTLRDQALEAKLASETLDVSLPVRRSPAERGRIHPISQVIDEIAAIFGDLGFAIAEGPDIETDYYNFTALNFPEGHPAREMHDTFFLAPDEKGERKVLRTHTSPVQIRTMENQKPPIRIVIPGKTYRQDSDATHSPMFHQVEGLVVDRTANIANMKWVLEEFCKAFFEVPSVNMRFRPSFFPFTEPSLEVDIQCDRSRPGEVRFGEGSDWMEILGCGMVHPNVLRAGDLDPDEFQGFAWGMGIDRIAMLKYGMPDLRAFFDADVRWLEHYGFRPLDMPTLFGGLSS